MSFIGTSTLIYASDVTIPRPYNDTLLCKGGSFDLSISFNSIGYYADSNIFYAELSDASGSFSAPTTIGTVTGSSAAGIYCTISTYATPGTAYRIRVRTTYPAEVSPDNGNNIRISAYPSFTLASNAPVCIGTSLSLTTTLTNATLSPVIFSWSGPAGFTSGAQNPSYSAVPLSGAGYYVLAANYYGCVAKDSINALVIAPTGMTIRTNSPVCAGEEVDILTDCSTCKIPGVSCAYTMKLPGGSVINNSNLLIKTSSATSGGKYIVAISLAGCTIKDSVIVDVRALPDSPWHKVTTPICLGDSLKLNAGTTKPGASFVWTGPNGFRAITANITIPKASYAFGGEYTVTAYSQSCASKVGKDSVIIGVPLTKPIISGDRFVCKGAAIKLDAKGNGNQAGAFEWSYNNVLMSQGNTYSVPLATKANTGLYTVVQKYMGCVSPPDSFFVEIPEVMKPIVAYNNPVCFNQPLNLHIDDLTNAEYLWIGPDANMNLQNATVPKTTFTDSGKYIAIVSVNGCKDSTIIHVKVLPLPVLTSVTIPASVCEGDTLKLNAVSDINSAKYLWTGPSGFSANAQNPRPIINSSGAGTYYVQAVSGMCLSMPDSAVVAVKESPQQVFIECNSLLHYGETLFLSSKCISQDVSYSWSGPMGYSVARQNDTLLKMLPSMGGKYIVTATSVNGCTSSADVMVTVDPIATSRYTVYPNPSKGNFTVSADLSKENHINYDIVSATGRVIQTGAIDSYKNSFKINIDLGDVPSGLYLMHMVNGDGNKTIQISIIK